MNTRPRITVAAIVEEHNRFLIVEEEQRGQLVYNQPAGHLERGESLIQAVIREVMEETGWHFIPEWITGIYRWQRPEDGVAFLRLCFSGRCHDQDLTRPLDDNIRRALWLPRADLIQDPSHLRTPMVLRCIDDYLAGRRYPLDLLVELLDQD